MTLTPSQLSTLDRIRIKVRRLTANPSQNQISDDEINNYINEFFVFDFPEHVRLFNLREIYDFYTTPLIEAYPFPRNRFTNVSQPVYMAGYQSFYTQSREQFYRIYPQLEFLRVQTLGNGTAGPYNLQFENRPILRGITYPPNPTVFSQVLISSVDANGNALIARDDGQGGFLDENDNPLTGTIDYRTGAVQNLNFSTSVPASEMIDGQSIPFEVSRPEAMLFFNDVFILRPVPDKSYKVEVEVMRRPTELLQNGSNPALEEWWEFIAYGAARKILIDRQDMTSLNNILPFYEEKKRLILRRTSQQYAQERTATIFTEQVQYPWGNFFNRF